MPRETTWEGMVELAFDGNSTHKVYCLAKSKEQAEENIKYLTKKKHPDRYISKIWNVKKSPNKNVI